MSAVIQLQPRETSALEQARKYIVAEDPDKAMAVLDKHLRRDPNDAQALVMASSVLKKAKHLPVAYTLARRAKEIASNQPEAWEQFGMCAQSLWRMDEAEDAYRRALARAKNDKQRALYLNSLASTYLDLGRFVDAEPVCRQSLAIAEAPNVRHNLGLALLAQRKWQEGWANYSYSVGGEARKLVKYKKPGEPTWDGTPNRLLCVYGEQGIGDEICAASMLPDVIGMSHKVIVDCDHRLKPLFRRSFPQASVHGTRWTPGDWRDEAESIEMSIAGFEVGKYCRNSDADFPGLPYLVPCPDRTAMWKSLFAGKGKPTIGIAWSGGIWQNASMFRELPLAEWTPIFRAVDAHWVSLQYRDASKEIEGHPVTQYPYATLTQDYDDTAALVAACDLVIAVQTSVVHLAGALGVPCWSMIPKTSQWRYGEAYEDLPWYKSVKLYRQTDEWPVERIANDLAAHFARVP